MSDDLRRLLHAAQPPHQQPAVTVLWRRGRRRRAARRALPVLTVVVAVTGGLLLVRDGGSRSHVAAGPSTTSQPQPVTPAGSLDRPLGGVSDVSVSGAVTVHLTHSTTAPALTMRGSSEALGQTNVDRHGGAIVITRIQPNGSSCGHCDDVTAEMAVADITTLNLNGGVTGTISGFSDRTDKTWTLTGGVTLTGDVAARTFQLTASGGVTADLSGRADHLDLTGSGGVELHLSSLVVTTAAINASGGAIVDADVTGRLDQCQASGGGIVHYGGNPTIGTVTTDPGGQCSRR